MAKNKTVIKKPKGSGSGNISITIENNLKATNIANPIPKKRKRRKQKATNNEELENEELEQILREGGRGGGGGLGPPLKDVSYIKPPSNNFTVWRDTLDSYNTTIPINQAQQMGLITAPMNSQPPPPPAPTVNITQPAIGNDGSSMREFMLAMTALQNNGYNRSNRIGLQFSDALDDPDFSSMSEAEQNAYIKKMFRNAEGMNSQSRFEDPDPEPEDIDQTDQALRDAGVTDDQIKNAKEIKNAKANGLKHGKENKNPTGKYKDMQEYKDAYAKGLEYFKKQEEEALQREEARKEDDFNSGFEAGYNGKTNKKKRNVDYTQGYNDGVAEKAVDDAAAAGAG
jgi:hypothetical protein